VVAGVANAVSEQLYGETAVSAEEIRRWFAYAGVETGIVEMNDRVVGYMDVERRAGGRIHLDVRVHPDAWESTTASALIGAAESWARAHGQEGDVLRAFAWEREDYLRQVLEERGYRFIRHDLYMLKELAPEPSEPEWPQGIVVQPFRPGEERVVYEADTEAFSDHWDFQAEPFAAWRERTVERNDFDPSLWLIAWDGEDVAGFSLNSWHSSGDPTYGWVHVLGVRRGAASRPLPLFYCLSQAGRALSAAWTQHDRWRPTTHGISSRIDDQAEDVPGFAVRVGGANGMYSVVAAATDSTTFEGTATVAALWSSLPGLPQPESFGDAGPRPLYVEAVHLPAADPPGQLEWFQHVLAPKHAQIVHPYPPGVVEILAVIREDEGQIAQLPAALSEYPSARGVVAEIHALPTALGEERAIVLSFPDPDGVLRSLSALGEPAARRTGVVAGTSPARYVIRPRIGSGDDPPPSELMTLWALIYAFSQLARYEPELWIAALDPDRSSIAVDLEHALDTGLELVPQLLVPAVTHGLMPRLMRERFVQEQAERDAAEAAGEGDAAEEGGQTGANVVERAPDENP
jgi:hypothetical protein